MALVRRRRLGRERLGRWCEAGAGADAGAAAGAGAAAARARELLQSIMEEISGGRMHYMFNRVGGLKEELPAGWLGRVGAAAAQVREDLPRIGAIVEGSEQFRSRTRDVGVLTGEQVRQFGVSGPAARASGVDFDLRRDEPYLAYAELAGSLRVVTRGAGDCLARFECLLDQVAVSLDLGTRARAGWPAAARPAERPDSQGAEDPRGAYVRLDRGPAGAERVLPGVPGREDAVAAQGALGLVQQRAGTG